MEIYNGFASYYDAFMDDIPYDRWSDYIGQLLNKRGLKSGLVCELGCGTGEITIRLRKQGFDMIGLDISEDMLMMARDKMYDEEITDIMFTHQDMRDFELYGTVDAFVSVCDSINYITDYDELTEVFRHVNNYLERDGIFIFDLKTDFLFKTGYADNSFSQETEEGILYWNNHYDTDSHLNYYSFFIEVKDETRGGCDEVSEQHVQRAYSLEEIKKALSEAGMVFEAAYDALSENEPGCESERIYVIAREGFQENKTYVK